VPVCFEVLSKTFLCWECSLPAREAFEHLDIWFFFFFFNNLFWLFFFYRIVSGILFIHIGSAHLGYFCVLGCFLFLLLIFLLSFLRIFSCFFFIWFAITNYVLISRFIVRSNLQIYSACFFNVSHLSVGDLCNDNFQLAIVDFVLGDVVRMSVFLRLNQAFYTVAALLLLLFSRHNINRF